MKTYKNLSGDSGVAAYEIGKTYIHVKFHGETGIYIYDYKRPGKAAVEQMKTLALKGQGLSTFISQHVGNNFASKK
jgi:hypothetical protein